MEIYDLAIIGSGVAGSFAAYKVATEYKDVKTVLFDLGKAPLKRRRALEGFLGCFPTSDGKLYLDNINELSNILNNKKVKSTYKYINNYLNKFLKLKVVKDKELYSSLEKKLKKNNFEIILNDFIQLYPRDIHLIIKDIASTIEDRDNLHLSFDNEVHSINKQKKHFIINTQKGEFYCKKILMCVGRSGWRWVSKFYSDFGLIENNDYAKFGIKIEMPTSHMKEFNKSNCKITGDNLEIGPFCWNGTVIPEDHIDLTISSFRSNEARWKSDKVSFNFIGHRYFPSSGYEQTDRIGKLSFILANDRISKERISTLLSYKSKFSILPEYDWIPAEVEKFANIVPDLKTKGYFYAPTILPYVPKINIGQDLSTDLENMVCAGEAAGFNGILSAMITGVMGVDTLLR